MPKWKTAFINRFLAPGSECTWKEYPDPEEIMEFFEEQLLYEDEEWLEDHRI